jgi:hypothetical protein
LASLRKRAKLPWREGRLGQDRFPPPALSK